MVVVILLFLVTTNQKVTGSNPVGLARKTSFERNWFFIAFVDPGGSGAIEKGVSFLWRNFADKASRMGLKKRMGYAIIRKKEEAV